ncbi:CCAAT-binding transcription factor (CBF-B/NF-YA) subunit B-domain-containing protein, partial [Bisporella sp. PMI_857]
SPQRMNKQISYGHLMNQQVACSTAPPVSNQKHLQSPEPTYVNAKQYGRILKRRVAREKFEKARKVTTTARPRYWHESRHRHASSRPRGEDGRFLKAGEIKEMEEDSRGKGVKPQEMPAEGPKRKADAETSAPNKKAKTDA